LADHLDASIANYHAKSGQTRLRHSEESFDVGNRGDVSIDRDCCWT